MNATGYMPNTPHIHPADADPARVAELQAVLADYVHAQQHEDVDAFVRLYDTDAVWVTAAGVRIVGGSELAAFTAKTLPGSTVKAVGRYDVTRIALVRDDLAVVSMDQEYVTPGGAGFTPPRRGRPTSTWLRRPEGWRIIAGQNTPVMNDDALFTESDRAALTAIVHDVESGLNDNDVELMTRHFSAEATVGDARGRLLNGIEAIDAAHKQAVAGFLADEHVRYDIEAIEPIAPQVALIRKTGTRVDPEGLALESQPSMRALYVVVFRGGVWQIVARQNTLIA